MSKDFFQRTKRDRTFLGGLMFLSLEEITDGKQRVERELCFVARVTDPDMLAKASVVELQEELALFLTPEGDPTMARIRIRRSTISGKTTDVLTFKVRLQGEAYSKESSVEAVQGLFEIFATLPGVKRTSKTRYVFPTDLSTGEEWEIDIFPLAEGQNPLWCKIDYEFKGSEHQPLPPFPEGLASVMSTKTTDPEERKIVDDLFANVFFKKG